VDGAAQSDAGTFLGRLHASCGSAIICMTAVLAYVPADIMFHHRRTAVHATNEMAPAGPPSEELQSAAALLHEEEQGAKAAALLSRVLNNIISKPGDEKYRWA
jgi:hypothetical protein